MLLSPSQIVLLAANIPERFGFFDSIEFGIFFRDRSRFLASEITFFMNLFFWQPFFWGFLDVILFRDLFWRIIPILEEGSQEFLYFHKCVFRGENLNFSFSFKKYHRYTITRTWYCEIVQMSAFKNIDDRYSEVWLQMSPWKFILQILTTLSTFRIILCIGDFL